MIDQDYSFIRLRDSFNDAKNLDYSPRVSLAYHGQTHLRTDESYLQITNTPTGISFQADYTVFVVDCSNEVLRDITDNVFIEEFTDYKGIQQISFEIVNIGFDFSLDNVYLRFESNTNANYVFWSNPIFISDFDTDKTALLTYRHNSIWQGFDFETVPYYNNIRIRVYKNQSRNTINIGKYTETTGGTRGTRAIITPFTEYNAEMMDEWTLDRLNVALTCSDCYIDCVKVNYSDPLEYTDVIELSNYINTTFLVNRDLNNTLDIGFQIYEGIQITSLVPQNSYTLGNLPVLATCIFNEDISINTGSLKLYNSSNTLLHTFTESDLSLVGTNGFQTNSDLNTYANQLDSYYILFDSGLIQASSGISFEGITNISAWTFSIAEPDFNSSDFNNNDFLT